MEYDLIRLFEHPVCLFDYIAPAIVALDRDGSGRCSVTVEWRRSALDAANRTELVLTWDLEALRAVNPLIDRQLASWRDRNANQSQRTEQAAVAIAVAVMAMIEPEARFTMVAEIGSRHDYYLNEADDEMIEVSGRWDDSLSGLFEEKRQQSDKNPGLRKRWVSVTVLQGDVQNRTEGLHP